MHFDYKAYVFQSALPLADIKAKLNALGPWDWIDRDSDRFGDYLSAQVTPDSMAKLYEQDPGHYQLDLKFRSDAPAAEAKKAGDEAHARIAKVLLPGLGAHTIGPGEVED